MALATAIGVASGQEAPFARSLRLQDCIDQALRANLDVQIERIEPQVQRWAISREWSAFEPTFSARTTYSDTNEPLDPETTASIRLDSLRQQEWQVHSAISGRLPLGTEYELYGTETRYGGDLVRGNHLFTGGVGLRVTQPLLRNFGWDANLTAVRLARVNRRIAEWSVRRKLIDVVSDVCRAYYELSLAVAEHNALLEDQRRAEALLANNRALAEAGLLSPLEVTQAEAAVADRRVAVLTAAARIIERTNALRVMLAEPVTNAHRETWVPVDPPPTAPVELDQATSLSLALARRPDYQQALERTAQRRLTVQYYRQQLWPTVDLQGGYGWNGRAASFGGLVDNVVSTEQPQWSVGVVVTVPLGNQRARANYEVAKLEMERSELERQRLEHQIAMEIVNAHETVKAYQQRLGAAHLATRLAEAALEAEQQKFRAGQSTSFLVLQAQTQLLTAQTSEWRARVEYAQAVIALHRAEGSTLEKYGIVVVRD